MLYTYTHFACYVLMRRFVYEFTYLWLTAAPPLLLLLVPLLLLLLVPLMLLLVPLLLVPLPHLLKAVEESLLPLCPPVAVLSRTATRAAFPSTTPVALWLTAASIPRLLIVANSRYCCWSHCCWSCDCSGIGTSSGACDCYGIGTSTTAEDCGGFGFGASQSGQTSLNQFVYSHPHSMPVMSKFSPSES